jgi:glycerol-3-phosphate O-acyltransferase
MNPVEDLVASVRFKEIVDSLVTQTGQPALDVRREAEDCLEEMVAQVGPAATRAWDRLGRWLTRAYVVDADTSALPEITELGRRHSLVFLPNHRSYLDPLVLRSVLAPAGFRPNYILGGINLAMWPVSELGWRSGLIFIRRSTKNDPVYPAMLRLYFGYLLQRHANLEWYLEGGRTRTGKLRAPKLGVLRYLVDALAAAEAEDVVLVPVAIVYDQQHEVEALSIEEAGGAKRRESLGALVRFARAQSRRRGRAYLRIGRPLFLRDALAEAAGRADSTELTDVVPRVAFEIAHRINAVTPITPSALVTFGLLGNDGRAMTLSETLAVLEPLVEYVRDRRLPLTSELDLGRSAGLRPALRMLIREGVVEEFTGGVEPVFAIHRERAHEASFYRNTVTHYFITRAIIEVAAVRCEQEPSGVTDALWEHALAIRDLLKYEFFFASKTEFAAQMQAEAGYAHSPWIQAEGELTSARISAGLRETRLLFAHRVIGPFLEAYAVVADRLARLDPAVPVDEDALVTESLGVARQRWLQHELRSPESISKDLMSGAIKLAGNRQLLTTGSEELRQARLAFAAELAEICVAVGAIEELARQRGRSRPEVS